jgi:hypothetical protein
MGGGTTFLFLSNRWVCWRKIACGAGVAGKEKENAKEGTFLGETHPNPPSTGSHGGSPMRDMF